MLHILLLILKIIGIIILVLLGTLLLAACCVMFVPVRYRAHVLYDDKACAQAKLSWLLHLVYLKADISPEAGGFHLVVRIAGIPFFDNQKPKKPGRKKTARQKPEKEPPKQQNEKIKDEHTINGSKLPAAMEPQEPLHEPTQQRALDELPQEPALDEPPVREEPPASDAPKKPKGIQKVLDKIKDTFSRIVCKIKGIIASIKSFFSGLVSTKDKIFTKLSNITNKKDALLAILTDEQNRTSFIKVKKLLFRIVRHLRPTYLSIRLNFGFDDPAVTGYALGLLSLLYPVYTDHIRLCPDFEKQVFNGECTAKGRLRASVFLFVVFQLIFDKDVRRILRSFKNI